MTDIVLADVRKSFGETKVLSGIDLHIRSGEFLTLVGPSGCGKSTLLRIIAGLESQRSGSVRIGERVVDGVRASDRDLAMVFQSYALYPHLSVRENMMTPLRMRDLNVWQRLPILGRFLPGTSGKIHEMRRTVDEVAASLQIDPLLERKPGQLSGGQRQRAALGRAMVRRPAAFLMDEPLSNLDAALRVHMRAELTELHRALGTTFIYVTHDQAEALTMSSRVAVMMGGDILQLGTPEEVYTDPNCIRVARFVGSPQINILQGAMASDGSVTAMGTSLKRKIANPESTAQGVSVGLRPEHLSLVADETRKDVFTGTVKHTENLGSDVYVHVLLKDGETRIVVRSEPHQVFGISHGETVRIGMIRGEAMVFDSEGQRLRFQAEEKVSSDVREAG